MAFDVTFSPSVLLESTDKILKVGNSYPSFTLRDSLSLSHPLETRWGSGAMGHAPGVEANWILPSLLQHHTPMGGNSKA